ncbi:SPW repeat protein [bacterium RCC_150]
MKKWTRWQDWVTVAAGLYAALAVLWTRPAGSSSSLMVVFGVLLIISGVINLAMPGTPVMEWIQAVLGALLFLSPWLGSYAMETGVAWTSWITGLVALVVTATAIKPSTEEHRHHTVSPSH